MFKILISDKLEKEGLDILTADKRFTVDCKFGIPADELQKVIKDYDALIVRSGTQVTAQIIDAADRLKVIGRAGVGLDNVDLTAATKKGIVAMNTPAGNTTSTAEQTMSLIMALSPLPLSVPGGGILRQYQGGDSLGGLVRRRPLRPRRSRGEVAISLF